MDARAINQTLEQQTWIDPYAETVQSKLAKGLDQLPAGWEDALDGEFMGHPVRSALATVPIGALATAVVLDGAASATGRPSLDTGADAALTLGIASAGAAAVAGWADWARLENPSDRRLGVIHAAANLVGLALFAGSLSARRHNARPTGRKLALLGVVVMGAAAFLGGSLPFEKE